VLLSKFLSQQKISKMRIPILCSHHHSYVVITISQKNKRTSQKKNLVKTKETHNYIITVVKFLADEFVSFIPYM